MITLLFFAFYIFNVSLEYQIDDTIIESVPKYFDLHFTNTFKIFKYIPSCPNNIATKNVYVQPFHEIYIYTNFSNIRQNEDEEEKFINYNEVVYYYSKLSTNFNCGEEYYIVYYVKNDISSPSYDLVLIDQDETIQLLPLLSDYFSFKQTEENKELLF